MSWTWLQLMQFHHWYNSPIKFDVIRYMFHLDAAGNPKTWEAVPGRYQREFVQQCSADIDWNVTSSIKQEYEQTGKRRAKENKARHFITSSICNR